MLARTSPLGYIQPLRGRSSQAPSMFVPNTQIRPLFKLSGKGCQGRDALSIQNIK